VELDPRGIGVAAAPQLERLKLIAGLEKSAEGRRKRRYDEALLSLLDRLPLLSLDAANAALADLGRIDPKRWETPALLAGLNGDGRGYETAAKFLEIAMADAGNPTIRAALEVTQKAAELELRYSSTRAAAEAASDRGDYAKAADLYQAAWTAIPARMQNGLDAASAFLLSGDTANACALLARLRESGDANASGLADAMLKQLEPIEPAAKSASSDASQFFRDRGPSEPVKIAALIPAVDRKLLEIYTRPLPKLIDDADPVLLLASLAADTPVKDPPLPALGPPTLRGENPWQEIASIRPRAGVPPAVNAPRTVQTVNLASADAASPHVLQVTSQPDGAHVFLAPQADGVVPVADLLAQPNCETPCNLQLAEGEYSLRLVLAGYQDVQQTVQLAADIQDLSVPLLVLRGTVIVEAAVPVELLVNGMPAGTQSPAELSLVPGLYEIGARFGSKTVERLLNVKPGARLKLELHP
jgi:tetratricopeptide (TPR) repeat protein